MTKEQLEKRVLKLENLVSELISTLEDDMKDHREDSFQRLHSHDTSGLDELWERFEWFDDDNMCLAPRPK
jgi:hypothetical protein